MSKATIKALCACGCGGDVWKRPERAGFIQGHQNKMRKGKPMPAGADKKSIALKKAWQDGKFEHMRHHSTEFTERRTAPLRGRKHNPEVIQKTREGIKRAWAAGKYDVVTNRHGEKVTWSKMASDTVKEMLRGGKVKFGTKEQMDKMRGMRDMEKLKATHRARLLGGHGLGSRTRDLPNHDMAKHWIIRDPVGRVYEFDNMQSWARKNEHLFLPDERPESRLPLWRRFVGGFNGMQRTDNKGVHSWRGWTLVSVCERESLGATDLLERKSANT